MVPISDQTSLNAAAIFSATLNEITGNFCDRWQAVDWSDTFISWRLFRLSQPPLPHQGWKIHVSAAAIEASSLCSVIAPVLFRLAATFKIARSLEDVIFINSGDAGAMQLGKVITIYPQNDEHAFEITTQVDRIWPISRGPEVQTDLHVRPGSAVSLRYGAFGAGPTVISGSGTPEFALTTPDGTLVPDTRRMGGEQPQWVPAPPLSCYPPRSHSLKLQEEFLVGGRRYVPLALLRDSPKTKIFLGFSLDTISTVILKAAYPGVAGDHRGVDAGQRLKKEFDILCALSSCTDLAPRPIEWVDGEWPTLIMEDFRGDLLSEIAPEARGEFLLPLANALAGLHHAGFMHGDLKLENAVRRGQQVGLIDFELAEREGCIASVGGTRGHLGPEVTVDAEAAFSRDVFALGGCIAQSVLGIPPGMLPNGTGRKRGLVELEGAVVASRLIGEFAGPDPSRRPSAAAAAAAIADRIDDLKRIEPAFGRPSVKNEMNWCRRASVEAASLVRRYSQNDVGGKCWSNEHFLSAFQCEAINIGAAGIIIGLITIDHALRRWDFVDEINSGAKWLSARPSQGNSAGLFTGNAGVAIALAVAGRRLDHDQYILASKNRLQNAAVDHREIDIFSGSAGVVFASCILSSILKDEWPLEIGNCALLSLKKCFHREKDIPVWSIDPRLDTHYLGCAHGSAGIAMALACWGHQVRDQESVNIALDTFRQLFVRGRTEDGSALRMTLDSARSHDVGNWCHGVAGYLWCILQAFGDHPALRNEIDWAVNVVRNSMTVGTATYCHGLAGRLELWRMLSAIPRFKQLAAAQAGKAVRALRLVHHKKDGKIAWYSDNPLVTTPDLWIGFLGPATALSLHAASSSAPLCSGRWLEDCANYA
jgi:serine/threonine protein kinase